MQGGLNMNGILKVLGKHGRITIPWQLRVNMNIAENDILSFTPGGANEIIVRKEKLCDGCGGTKKSSSVPLMEFLDSLTPEQQYNALVHLSLRWSENSRKPCRRRD